ncbi:MAG: hypothetical protein AB8V03_03425 [Francisella endosymbiont of Hyalomma asiaticum]
MQNYLALTISYLHDNCIYKTRVSSTVVEYFSLSLAKANRKSAKKYRI